MVPEVGRQRVRRLVAPCPSFSRAFMVTQSRSPSSSLARRRGRCGGSRRLRRRRAELGDPGARTGRFLLADGPLDLGEPGLPELLAIERQRARQELVQDDAEAYTSVRVSISRPPISACSGSCTRGADHDAQLGVKGALGEVLRRRLRHAEVDDLRHRWSSWIATRTFDGFRSRG